MRCLGQDQTESLSEKKAPHGRESALKILAMKNLFLFGNINKNLDFYFLKWDTVPKHKYIVYRHS